jgi:hypothetical protein
MRHLFLLPCLVGILSAADILVYGGTAAGVSAAVHAARLGHQVTLVAPERHVGGIAVDGLGGADINNHWFRNDHAVGGIAKEFYERLGKKYGKSAPAYLYESHVAESVFEDLLREAKVIPLRGERLCEPLTRCVEKQGPRIIAIRTESGKRLSAAYFIDATMEGDLLAGARVSTTWGREANSLYNETKNGIRAETTHAQFQVPVDPYRIPGDPKSGVIPTIQDEPLGTPGAGDRNIQAFCFRICLTRDPANRLPVPKPAGFNRADYEIYFRYLRAGGKLWWPTPKLPNGKTDLGSWHDLSANLYGMNREWPNGTYAERQRIFEQHLTFTQGLIWLIQNDPEIPAELRDRWKDWGLPKDEFVDHNHWPRQLYIRDGRRMVSDYVVTEHHTRRINPTPVADPVAVAIWPTDTHSVRRIVRDGKAYNEGFVFDDNQWGPLPISYRSLAPKPSEASNLLTPTCLSASHVAWGAIRLEQTFLALGEVAAEAVALAAEQRQAVQRISYDELRRRLLSHGNVLNVALVPSKVGVFQDGK